MTTTVDAATAYSITGRRPVIVTNRSSPCRDVRSSMNGGMSVSTSKVVAPAPRSAWVTSGKAASRIRRPAACR